LDSRHQEIRLLLVSETAVHTADGRLFPLRTFQWDGHAILDACVVKASYGHLLVLTADGALHGIDLNTHESAPLCGTNLPGMTVEDGDSHFGKPRHRLHASSDGRYAAIVVDRGRSGIVVETQDGKLTMNLHGGDYCEETVPFSACFLRFGGRNVLVHRTDWNRLDAADPRLAGLSPNATLPHTKPAATGRRITWIIFTANYCQAPKGA
jgi:hypothetical protein